MWRSYVDFQLGCYLHSQHFTPFFMSVCQFFPHIVNYYRVDCLSSTDFSARTWFSSMTVAVTLLKSFVSQCPPWMFCLPHPFSVNRAQQFMDRLNPWLLCSLFLAIYVVSKVEQCFPSPRAWLSQCSVQGRCLIMWKPREDWLGERL